MQIAPEVGRAAKVAPALYSTYCIGGAPKSIKPTQWAYGPSCQLCSSPLVVGYPHKYPRCDIGGTGTFSKLSFTLCKRAKYRLHNVNERIRPLQLRPRARGCTRGCTRVWYHHRATARQAKKLKENKPASPATRRSCAFYYSCLYQLLVPVNNRT